MLARDTGPLTVPVLAGATALAAGTGIIRIRRQWRRLRNAPAETQDTSRFRVRGFHAPAGGCALYARTAIEDRPDLPPLILVHGLVVSSKVMEPLIGCLAPHFRVLAPDLPGFGESSKRVAMPDIPEMAEALASWLHGLGIDRTRLFGLSFGCNVVAELAVRHPDLVERLVLQGPAPDPKGRSLPVAVWRDLANARREKRSSFGIAKIDYAKAGLPRAAAAIRLALNARIEAVLPHVQSPTLVVCGSRDLVSPVPWSRHLARLLPRGEFAILDGEAHVLPYGAPEALADVMLPFLLETA